MIELRLIRGSTTAERNEEVQDVCADRAEPSADSRQDWRSCRARIRVVKRHGRRRLDAVFAEPIVEDADNRRIGSSARVVVDDGAIAERVCRAQSARREDRRIEAGVRDSAGVIQCDHAPRDEIGLPRPRGLVGRRRRSVQHRRREIQLVERPEAEVAGHHQRRTICTAIPS